MRILYVITKANWGGAQRYVYDLATAAAAAGHEVAVAYGESGLLVERLATANIRTIPIASLARDMQGAREMGALTHLRALIRAERPEVIHLNSSKAAGLGAIAARLEKVPKILFTAHGWAFNESRPLWEKFFISLAAGATVYLAHETICVSKAVARDIAWLPFCAPKLRVIYNGVRPEPLLPRIDARQELLPGHLEDFWIGMVSELHPTKRVEDAIEAFAPLAKQHPRAILVVCGEGEERAKLERRIAEKELGGRVFLLGFVPDAPRHLSTFDVFLHASESEAFAFVILEAGCASLPVVATAVGGIPEIIANGVCGLLVPPHDPPGMTKALERMFDPAVRNPLAEALHARVRRDFTLEAMVRATLARYPAGS